LRCRPRRVHSRRHVFASIVLLRRDAERVDGRSESRQFEGAGTAGAAAACGDVHSGCADAHPYVWITSPSDIVFDGAGMISAARHAGHSSSVRVRGAISWRDGGGLCDGGGAAADAGQCRIAAQVRVLHHLGLTAVDEVYGASPSPSTTGWTSTAVSRRRISPCRSRSRWIQGMLHISDRMRTLVIEMRDESRDLDRRMTARTRS
jgi:hypothetical protein